MRYQTVSEEEVLRALGTMTKEGATIQEIVLSIMLYRHQQRHPRTQTGTVFRWFTHPSASTKPVINTCHEETLARLRVMEREHWVVKSPDGNNIRYQLTLKGKSGAWQQYPRLGIKPSVG